MDMLKKERFQASREKVRCGHHGCAYNGQRCLHKRHKRAVHKDGPPKFIMPKMFENWRRAHTVQVRISSIPWVHELFSKHGKIRLGVGACLLLKGTSHWQQIVGSRLMF